MNIRLREIKISVITACSFLVTLLLCIALIVIATINEMNLENITMQQLLLEKANKANDSLSRLLYKTQTLSVFALRGHTQDDFDEIALSLMDDPAMLNILIAPRGVVKYVYPLEENKAVVGFNFFGDGAGNKEALLAKETKQLVLGGPFDAVQGGQIIVGRYPVFNVPPTSASSDSEQTNDFWGLVSVTLKYPDALVNAGFDELRLQGFEYEVWRINPDTNEKQIITGSGYTNTKKVRYIEKAVTIHNAEWFFRIYPIKNWYEHFDFWLMSLIALFISVLVAYVVQNNVELTQLKSNFEKLSQVDALTGVLNRRFFMETAVIQLDRSERLKSGSALLMMDLDFFKKVNDTYGHLAGDKVLQVTAAIIKGVLRPYDILGRYGGEEFVVFASDTGEENAKKLAERIRLAVAKEPIIFEKAEISATISIGVTALNPSSTLNRAINYADQALYEAKNSGRNKVIFKRLED
jgi:diguanylate cyclase (GGDEF)-like protein